MENVAKKTHETDLIALAMKVLAEKRLLAKFVITAAILGVIVALGRIKSYKADVILAPEMSSGGMGMAENIMDMASSFGIDIGGKSSVDAIYPEIYPTLMSSNDFILQMFDVPVTLKDDNAPRTYREHLKRDLSAPFWTYPARWISSLLKLFKAAPSAGGKGGIDPFRLSQEEEDLINAIRGAISCVVDKKTSLITISVTDQDAQVAALIADTLQLRLQKYITDYRTRKARADMDYYATLYDEAKDNYAKAREEFTDFADKNSQTVLQSFIVKRSELENEMELKYRLYTQVATQLQAAKAKVQERTPAFIIIQAATVPNRSSSMPRAYTVILFIALGIALDALWILFGRSLYANRRQRQGTGS